MKKIAYFGNFFECVQGISKNHRLVYVIFERNKENDRIVRFCRDNNITYKRVETSDEIIALLPAIGKKQPDFFLVGSFGIIFNKEIIHFPRYATINVHPGILPDYRGRHPLPQAILNREAKAGVTVHVMTESIDRGDILATKSIDLDYNTSYRQNEKRLLSLLPKLVDEGIRRYLSERSVKLTSAGAYYKPLPKYLIDKIVNAETLKEIFNASRH